KSGQAVANFSLATSESWTRDGNRDERTERHRVVAWDKTADQCTKYLSKGRIVYVEGSLRTRDWEDKDGAKRQTTEVHAQTVQFLGSPRDGGGGGGSRGGFDDGPPPDGPPGGDDIPF